MSKLRGGTRDELDAVWQALCDQLKAGVSAWDWANGIPAGSAVGLFHEGTSLVIPSRPRPEYPSTREVILSRGEDAFLLALSSIQGAARLVPRFTSKGEHRIDVEGMMADVRQAAIVILKRALF